MVADVFLGGKLTMGSCVGFCRRMEIGSLRYEYVGVLLSDFFSWVIFPLGLCQETRSMMINQVEDGVWNGPASMIRPLANKSQIARQLTEQRV